MPLIRFGDVITVRLIALLLSLSHPPKSPCSSEAAVRPEKDSSGSAKSVREEGFEEYNKAVPYEKLHGQQQDMPHPSVSMGAVSVMQDSAYLQTCDVQLMHMPAAALQSKQHPNIFACSRTMGQASPLPTGWYRSRPNSPTGSRRQSISRASSGTYDDVGDVRQTSI
jgi:hypothetical protein